MIEGKTSSGFKYKIEDEALDDYELLEALCEIDEGKTGKIPSVLTQLLGEDQKKGLKDHVRTESGRVPASKMLEELGEIMASNQQGKNS